MRLRGLIALTISLVACSSFSWAQTRALINTATAPVRLPTTLGQEVVLGSVSLGKPRAFSLFNIQAAGTIAPDPDLNGAAYQLQFLVCDQPDCTGDIKSDTRILQDPDSAAPAQVIATRSFGVTTHNVEPVVLTDLQPRNSGGVLYLAVALKLLHGSGTYTGKLNLLRVDVMP